MKKRAEGTMSWNGKGGSERLVVKVDAREEWDTESHDR
jgi:hypothetical protein